MEERDDAGGQADPDRTDVDSVLRFVSNPMLQFVPALSFSAGSPHAHR